MPGSESVRVHCHDCNRATRHQVCHEVQATAPAAGGTAAKAYQIVQCLGCDTVSFRELVTAAGETAENLYPPRMIRDAKDYHKSRAPAKIVGVYDATLIAFNNGADNSSSFILCSAGVRTLLELICDDLGVGKPTDDLRDKVAGLAEKNHITGDQMRHLQDARGQGNDALHRGEIPPQELLARQLDAVEVVVHNLYVMPEPFNKGERLPAVVVRVDDAGVTVKVGKSTEVLICPEDLGEAGPAPAVPLRVGQRVEVKVVNDRDEPLRVSKREADADAKREADARLRQEEADRARRAALQRLKLGRLLTGVVMRIEKDGVVVKVTHVEDQDVSPPGLDLTGWLPNAEIESRNPRPRDRVSVVVITVRPHDQTLELSERMTHRERAYRKAEEAFRLRTILEGRVTEAARDGSRVHVNIGRGGLGFVHLNQLGEGDAGNLDDWRDKRIPVRVTSPPDAARGAAIQFSHRAALNRMSALERFHPADRKVGRVGKAIPEGQLVNVDGTDGLIRKADMGRQLRTDDEIPVEVVEVNLRSGYLGLKAVFADGDVAPAQDEADLDSGDDDHFEGEGEQGYAEPFAPPRAGAAPDEGPAPQV